MPSLASGCWQSFWGLTLPARVQAAPAQLTAQAPVERILVMQNGAVLRAELVEDDDLESYILIKNLSGGTTRIPRAQLRSMQPAPPRARRCHRPCSRRRWPRAWQWARCS